MGVQVPLPAPKKNKTSLKVRFFERMLLMKLLINEDNLSTNDINDFSVKVRAILIDENNQILIANYGNVILLPGGKVDNGETNELAIMRELYEELGQVYTNNELNYFGTLDYYQKNYPKRDGTFEHRLLQTHYFICEYKGVDLSIQRLTKKEKKDGFKLELVSLDDLEKIILENENDNPRNKYFQKELLTILETYENYRKQEVVKKLKPQLKNPNN